MNPVKGELKVVLADGVDRIWHLNGNDIIGIQSVMQVRNDRKISYIKFISEMGEWSPDDFRLVIWYGLKRRDPDLTEEKVGELLTMESMLQFLSDFSDWVAHSMPDPLKKKAQEALQKLE